MDSTCWTVIRGAAGGNDAARAEFARRYAPVIRMFLRARWRGGPLVAEVDDATQEVFVACFKDGGALERVDPEKPGRFRSYLYGIVLNVARRTEERRRKRREERLGSGFDVTAQDPRASEMFDRAWASALLKRAARLQARRADSDEARRRVELLQLRFGEGLAIREIAARWRAAPARVHHAYATAREEFKRALLDVIREEDDGRLCSAEEECERLISCFL